MTAPPKKKAAPRRPVRKAVPARGPKRTRREPPAVAAAHDDDLSPGDTVECSTSMEVRGPAGALWLKSGVTTQVRPDENALQANERAERFVRASISRKARAIIEGRE